MQNPIIPGSNQKLVAPFLFLTVALLFCPTPATAQLTPKKLLAPTVKEYGPQYQDVENAFKAYNRRDVVGAKRSLQAACKKHPELAPAELMLALIHLSVGRRKEAEAAIESVVVEKPEDPEAYILLADLALSDGRRTVAELGYHRGRELLDTIKSNPHRVQNLKIRLHAGSASLAEARGQYNEAAKQLEAWIALAPENPLPRGSLGRVHFNLKDFDAARAAFTKLKELDKDAPPVEIALGRLYSDAGMDDHAKVHMEAAIKKAGNDPRARLTIAEWALKHGLLDMAKLNVNATLSLDKESVGAQVLLARLARMEGDLSTAESILSKVVLKSPNSFAATNELARTLAGSADEKKRDAGLAYARRNFQTFQNRNTVAGREASMTFAWLLLANGRTSEAEAAIATLSTGSTLSTENAYYVGKIYADSGKNQVAISALEAALAKDIPFAGRAEAEKLLNSLKQKP